MSIRNLDKIFDPRRVAVIGASDTPTSVGYTVLRNLVGSGFPRRRLSGQSEAGGGPGHPRLQGHRRACRTPRTWRVICTPAPSVPALVRELGEAGTRGIVIISAGFREIGEEGPQAGGAGPPGAAEVRRHADPRAQLPGDHRARAST